jgi:hypothetical protein
MDVDHEAHKHDVHPSTVEGEAERAAAAEDKSDQVQDVLKHARGGRQGERQHTRQHAQPGVDPAAMPGGGMTGDQDDGERPADDADRHR